jgi:hypothetical protein
VWRFVDSRTADNGGSLGQPGCRFSKTGRGSINCKGACLCQNSELKEAVVSASITLQTGHGQLSERYLASHMDAHVYIWDIFSSCIVYSIDFGTQRDRHIAK